MSLRALVYAYVLGGLTFIPLVIFVVIAITIYTSVPVGDIDANKATKTHSDPSPAKDTSEPDPPPDINDLPKTRKGWLTVRRTFEESTFDGSYVTLVRSYLDARSKDPKRSRPKDMWYVVLKGKVVYLYEDESMMECEAAIELGGHDVVVYPEGLLDGELFTRRNAICLKPRVKDAGQGMPSVTKEMAVDSPVVDEKGGGEGGGSRKKRSKEREDKVRDAAVEEAFTAPWFIFVRSCVEMEDWYLSLVHASDHPAGTPMLSPLQAVFLPSEMNQLVNTLDEQPDVIPMRWLNALLGRIFFSFYRTQVLESYIIGRLMKKLSKVKRPAFLTDIAVTQFSIGNKAPTLSKPMLKELTKEGDASLEVGLSYKGEIRATVQATAVINLGARFKSYTVKLVLAVVLRELEGNLLVKVKRPPSSRIWYAFTKPPRMVINVEPIVSDRQITWNMILSTIEARIEETIIDSVVMPNMDDISFFDSSDYAQRGGLWSDAARSEKPMMATGGEKEPKEPTPEVDVVPLTEDTEPQPVPRTKSAEQLTGEASPLDGIPIVRSSTTMSSPEHSAKNARRRSWFSPAAPDELDDEVTKEEDDPEVVRGRRSRAASSAQQPDDTPTATPASEPVGSTLEDDGHDVYGYLTPQFSPRSSQGRSRSLRTHSISSSAGGDDLSDSSATSKGARHSLGTSTTSSFLSTLKSKAADKQALSNSAKEAIRKWGVNWGGLKKDSQENSSQDDVPDAGPSTHRTRTESTHTRSSYADVRAAVDERKERGQLEKVERASSPIPIQGRARSPSSSSGRRASPSDHSSSPASSSRIQEGSSIKSTGVPLSRSFGENTSKDPFKDRDFVDDAGEYPAPSLIHTQPSQARTMTIPGIHASHRGEIMSMGNVAASPLPDSKPKGATIQSMYRLWKSPILSGQQYTPEPHSEGTERNQDVTPLSLTPDVSSPPPRLVPPPLPPRTIPSVAVRHAPEVSDDREPPTSPASEALKSIASRDESKRASLDLTALANGSGSDGAQSAEPPRGAAPEVSLAAASDTRPPLPPRRIQAPA